MVGGEEHDDFESRTGGVKQLHGRRSPADKETWWWNDKVQDVIKARHIWETSGWQEGRYSYRQANKAAKKAVAQQGAGNE